MATDSPSCTNRAPTDSTLDRRITESTTHEEHRQRKVDEHLQSLSP